MQNAQKSKPRNHLPSTNDSVDTRRLPSRCRRYAMGFVGLLRPGCAMIEIWKCSKAQSSWASPSGEDNMLRVGDKVTWFSQSAGYSKRKTGQIVRILQSHEWPTRVHKNEFPEHKRMFDGLSIPGRKGVGYLVEVRVTKNSKPLLYMPYPSRLELVQ